MRRAIKKRLLEVFKAIYQTHNSIKEFIDKKESEAVISLLSNCQEAALYIGNTIEDFEGEGVITIPLLEEYCEMAYKVALSFSNEYMGSKICKLLNKKLVKAENSLKNDIKTKFEVVFMPYKASMWDSLESVWKAATEDPDCDVYVVVLPYYDRKDDHSFDKFHYEKSYFPKYVNITHYEDYNLQERRPDIIYIHNPYDQYNYVTSVEPKFYSYNLKRYTDTLVYIPYYVVSDIVPEHLCTLSACIFSNKVIVQSDSVRDTYIKNFKKIYGNSYKDLENKFISLGSPKFDAIVNAEKTEYDLPEEWRNIINNKKIILYNTSVSSILNGNKEYLKKIVSVLKFFSEHHEVILWWRPHPLSTAVYNSMKNYLLDEYIEILDNYKKEKYGIFDDTPDLHRAIACSDAYYGDRSSLVAMYQLTGKPVLLQDTTINNYTDNDNYIEIGIEDLYDDGEYLWFSATNFNGLFKMDKRNMEPIFVGSFPNELFIGQRLYVGIAECNDKLYFSPFSAHEIAVYDMKKDEFKKINIDKRLIENDDCKFYSAITYKNNVIFIPYSYNAILCLDTDKGKLTYCSEWVNSIKNDINRDRKFYYFRKAEIIDSELYLPSCCTDKLLIFNIITHSYEIKNMHYESTSYHGIVYKNNNCIFSPNTGELIKYDLKTYKSDIINELNMDIGIKSIKYIDICDANDKIWLFPHNAKSMLEIDTLNNTIRDMNVTVFMFEKKEMVPNYIGKYMFAKRITNTIYAYNIVDNCLIKYEFETSKWTAYKIRIRKDYLKEFTMMKADSFAQVNADITRPDLSNYLESIVNIADLCRYLELSSSNNSAIKIRSKIREQSLTNADGTAGIKIHNYIKKMV